MLAVSLAGAFQAYWDASIRASLTIIASYADHRSYKCRELKQIQEYLLLQVAIDVLPQ